MSKAKPCSECGTSVASEDQVRSGGRVRCGPCVHAERLRNAQDTDQCAACEEPIGAHRELRENGTRVCADCGTGASAHVRRPTTGTAASQAARRGAAATEEDVAAELEKLIGPTPRGETATARAPEAQAEPLAGVTEQELIEAMNDLARQPGSAAAPAKAAPKQTRGGLTEEEVAAELEKLMGSSAA
jgi:hypothetical protein